MVVRLGLVITATVADVVTRLQQLRVHAANLAKLDHRLLRVVLLDYFLVVLGMFQLDMLVETSFGTVALGAVLDRAFVMSCNLSGRPPMALLFLVIDLKRHVQHLFMFTLVRLTFVKSERTYLETVQFVTEILLLV